MIELCAGTAAVSFAALGARFPVSRIGGKAGWSAPILEALGVDAPPQAVMLVEADVRLAELLRAMVSPASRAAIVRSIDAVLSADPRETWQRAKAGTTPADTLLWMAGARGGVGGFKGRHLLRESVDGFIPGRASLARRVEAFDVPAGVVSVQVADVSALDPTDYAPGPVYVDPPYVGRTGYRHDLREPVEELARRWTSAGHRVVVSEARQLPGADDALNITPLRRGQVRRSLTTDATEWLSIFYPARRRT